MAKKTKNTYGTEPDDNDMQIDGLPATVDIDGGDEIEVAESEPVVITKVADAPITQPVVTVNKKKRIRIRKKATKKLSVAVLCTNPSTRRFI